MLTFSRDPQGHFVVTETIMGFTKTSLKRVIYSVDLDWIQVDNDPKREMTYETFHWFLDNYLLRFVEVEIAESGINLVKGTGMGKGLFAFEQGDKQTVWFNHKDLLESLQAGSMLDEIPTCLAID